MEKVTHAISKGTEKVDEGVKLIGEVQEAIGEVADAARRSADASDLIMNATSEQASGIMQASQLEQNISVMSKEIAEATIKAVEVAKPGLSGLKYGPGFDGNVEDPDH